MGLIEGFLKGVFLAAGARTVGAVENKKRLNSCLMSEEVEGIPTFTYKGHIYNKARYIDLCVQSIQKLKKRYVREGLTYYQKIAEKGTLSAIDAANMEAYAIVWADKRCE